MNDQVSIDRSYVTGMADDADAAATDIGDSATLLSGDAAAAASGLDGFITAGRLTATQEAWDRKAAACRNSLGHFSGALRATATALPNQDAANASGVNQAVEFVFPEGSPILGGGPPWDASAGSDS